MGAFAYETFFERGWISGKVLADHAFQSTTLGAVGAAEEFSFDSNGLKINTAAAAGSAIGITGLNLANTASQLTTSNSPTLEVDIRTPAALTGIFFFVGLCNAAPSTATGRGHWDNASLTQSAGFWFEKGAYSDYLQCFYEGTGLGPSLAATTTAPAVSTIYRLKVDIASNRIVTYSVNGVQAFQTNIALTAAQALYPYIHIIGNNKAMHVQRVYIAKTYS